MIGTPDSTLIQGVLKSVTEHRLPHAVLSPQQVLEKYPEFRLSAGEVAVFEENAGYLDPERCIAAHLDLAKHYGASLRFGEHYLSWSPLEDSSIRVLTDKAVYRAKKLVFSVGAWAPEVYAKELRWPLHVERRVLFWFEPRSPHHFTNTPIYIWEVKPDVNFYGFPKQSGAPFGVKVASHSTDQSPVTTPSTIDRVVRPAEIEHTRSLIAERLPDLNGKLVETATCMYTATPNGHFLISPHPRHASVLCVSPCSGHGFKFASVIGEIVSQLTIQGKTSHDISLFALDSHDWYQSHPFHPFESKL